MSKKNEAAVETIAEEVVAPKLKKRKTKIWSLVVIAAVAVLGYKLWENPKLLHQFKDMLANKQVEEDVYLVQINELQKQLAMLKTEVAEVAQIAANPDLSEVNQKLENMENITVNTIKSKADVDAVLGLVQRMDRAESKIDDLAKVTDKSALTLTAAMLVKDAAVRGGSFVYEAEVLNELAADNYKIAKEIAVINKAAVEGVPSLSELQNRFAEIYATEFEVTDENLVAADNWKDRIYLQLQKVVKIEKKTDEKNQALTEKDVFWATLSEMVAIGETKQAVSFIDKPLNEEWANNKNLQEWKEQAEIYNDFYDAVARISANALAVMKVKFLQNN